MAMADRLGWVTLTLVAYMLALRGHRRSGAHPLMLPVATGSLMVMAALTATGTPHSHYLLAVAPLQFWIGPATVAMAVPLFGQLPRLKAMWWPLSVALVVGSLVAVASTLLIAWMWGADTATLAALAPKSATMPIATALSQRLGGPTPLAAAAVAVTGMAGAALSGPVLRWTLGTPDDVTLGFSLGLSAHAVGTARALEVSDTAGAFAVMAMGLNGLLTALWMPIVGRLLGA